MKKTIRNSGILAGILLTGALSVTGATVTTQSEVLGNGSDVRSSILSSNVTSAVSFLESKCGEGKCGEGKCGGNEAKETKTAKKSKTNEAKCGEGKCGTKETKATKKTKTNEAKCGEGKCGGDMKKDSTKKSTKTEKKAKTNEAKCGEGKCGSN